jgi:phosphoglycerate dehydrogenase-like enzyme
MTKILLAFDNTTISAQQQGQLRHLAPDHEVVQTADEDEIAAMLDDVEIAVGQFPKKLLTKARNLRWFQQWSAGADWLLEQPEVQQMDFVLTSASGVHAIPISEHIFAFLLAFARNLPQAWQAQQEGIWMHEETSKKSSKDDLATYSRSDVFELAGKTMLLIGIGDIGERTAQIARALEMGIIGVRHNPDHNTPGVSQMVGPEDLLTVLPQADVVVSTVPLTEETHHLLDQAAFDAMKEGAYLINIGRGGTIDQEALIAALRSGKLAGAGLDVFEEEPLTTDSPLWTMDNVLITPHSSGATPQYHERAFAIFLDNLQRYLAGEELRNVVNKEKGY